jgi:hypothetical protein
MIDKEKEPVMLLGTGQLLSICVNADFICSILLPGMDKSFMYPSINAK